MHLPKIFLLVCLLVFCVAGFAQPGNMPVKITMDKTDTGDSIWLTVSVAGYTKTSSLMLTASLQNTASRDTFFLPVIDAVSNFCFVFPSSISDNLLLRAWFSPGIFRVSGQVNDVKKQTAIKAILITDNEKIFNKEIAIQKDNSFTLPALVFEKKASLAFNYKDDKLWQTHPDVTLSVKPAISDFTQLVFSSVIKRVDETGKPQPEKIILNDSIETLANDKYKALEGVQVVTTKKTNIEKFNDEYSSGVFNDGSERVIDCLDNNGILSYPNCLNYLQRLIPGLSVSTEQSGDMQVKWRGKEVKAFYIDEIAVDIEQVLGVSTSDIAMLKVYPPPFFGSSNGDGGAIALYTRRGAYGKSNGIKWLFSLKGYSPQINVLFKKTNEPGI